MPNCLLFCTAQVLPERITYLANELDAFDGGNGLCNCISLVRNTSQCQFDDPTQVPIEGSFETEFEGYSIEALGDFVKTRLPRAKGSLTHRTFAVLDERSLREDTITVACWVDKYTDEAVENCDFSEANKLWEKWVARRVPFHQLSYIVASLQDLDMAWDSWRDLKPEAGTIIDDNGVFSLPSNLMPGSKDHPYDHDVPPREKRL